VPHGSLLIVGGGLTKEIVETFVERAGGGKARIVVLPTAVPAQERPSSVAESYEATLFARLGVEDITVLDQTDFETVNSAAFCEKLARATGIWFGGGRQWRFVDAYEESGALEAMKKCLQQGGIIGGSSAGATIQGELLIRGAPVGNHIMVQDGYRRGFEFLSGVGIDQHFSERSRFLDLEQTIRRFPAVLGLGIDEDTALLVEKTRARVLGQGAVYVYAAELLPEVTTPLLPADRPLRFANGQEFDLKTLEVLNE
jgi:cyanophycinase